jgi:glutamyl-tRNA synthetase
MMIDVGPKTADVILSWENLYAYNRKILDAVSDRYFFVEDPIELTVTRIPKMFKAKLRLHPEHPERGAREYTIKPIGEDKSATFWISRKDADSLAIGKEVRLMELLNIKLENVKAHSAEASFASESYEESRETKAPLIHWVPVKQDMPCKVIMPDASTVEGIAESACKKLKSDSKIQFERFGFVRIDRINSMLTAYYAHK